MLKGGHIMDFRQTPQSGTRPSGNPTPVTSPANTKHEHGKYRVTGKGLRILNIIVLFGIAVLLAALAIGFTRTNNSGEFKYVNTSKYQAVFLSNGQVYFGKITSLNGKYVNLGSVFYLTQSGSTDAAATDTSNSNYSLVKLGCQQIHDPYDQMLINRDQVTFWENLQSDGKVVTSIAAFNKQNPKGPDCSQVSTQTQASTTGTQGTTTDTTKK
jgi:hypothetical protein